MTSKRGKKRDERGTEMASGVGCWDGTTDLTQKVTVTFWEQMSQRLKNKSKVDSKENESFKKCDMG